MNTQTVTNALTSDFSKELGKTFVSSAAIMAGILAGSSLYSTGSGKVNRVRKIRAAKKAASKNES